jgi:hypothetical protein
MRCSYCGGSRELLEVAIETGAQLASIRALGTGPRQYDKIPRRQSSAVAKRFTSKAFEAVAIHGAFGGAA